jgi:hypothetical protein
LDNRVGGGLLILTQFDFWDHSNIGFDHQFFKLVIRLMILIIDYRTALHVVQHLPMQTPRCLYATCLPPLTMMSCKKGKNLTM